MKTPNEIEERINNYFLINSFEFKEGQPYNMPNTRELIKHLELSNNDFSTMKLDSDYSTVLENGIVRIEKVLMGTLRAMLATGDIKQIIDELMIFHHTQIKI